MTAFLIVMSMAGFPGVSLACELWCSTSGAETHHIAVGCHGTRSADVPGEQVVATGAECHGVPAVRAYLNETRPPETRLVAMISTVHDTAAVLAHRGLLDEGWPVFNGPSPRLPAFRTILRI